MTTIEEECFHSMTPDQALAALLTDKRKGLTTKEAEERLLKYGVNMLPTAPPRSVWERLWSEINSVVIYVLLVGAALSFGFHHLADGAVILAVVMVNVSLGFWMEGKAENSTKQLSNMMSTIAHVLRDDEKNRVDASKIVKGDIFFLEAGDVVPADGRVLAAADLHVLEAPLTGESHAILKTTAALPAGPTPLAERSNMVFSGTQVIKGAAMCATVHTGSHCEIGKISSLLKEVEQVKTPLVLQLEVFGRYLSVAILIIALGSLGAALGRGYATSEAFSFAIGIAVAAIPEGLPACVTVTFAIGVRLMALKGAVIKSLPAVETIGSVDVICSDKTGTLTTNKMTVKSICTPYARYELSDAGGILTEKPHVVVPDAPYDSLLTAIASGIFCNDSTLHVDNALATRPVAVRTRSRTASFALHDADMVTVRMEDDIEADMGGVAAYSVEGDPTETCMLTLAAQLSNARAVKRWRHRYPKIAEVPFDSATKFMATMHELSFAEAVRILGAAAVQPKNDIPISTVTLIFVKGAPEKILSFCPCDITLWMKNASKFGMKGMRVLGLAYKVVSSEAVIEEEMASPEGFIMLSLLGIIDPPRPEAIIAVKHAQEAGITVKMITGDHPVTAVAIGRILGLQTNNRPAITGADLDGMADSQDDFDHAVSNNDIFARTTPEHKLRIVQSLQRQGRVCSMTGDGVNDAPALKAANIGVAMGITGTEVAKDAANMILTDDNFATIVDAIRVGRCTYNNLIKIMAFMLPTNGGQAFCIILALAIGVDVPITALQILWVNLVTSLGLVLAFEKPHEAIMHMPPRRNGKAIFGKFLRWRVIFMSLVITAVVLGNFQWEKQRLDSIKELRTVAVNTLCVSQVGYIFSCRRLRENSGPRAILTGNPYLYVGVFIVAFFQVLFTYAPPFQYLFLSEPLDGESWGKIIFWGCVVFAVTEAEKWLAAAKAKYMKVAQPVDANTGGLVQEEDCFEEL